MPKGIDAKYLTIGFALWLIVGIVGLLHYQDIQADANQAILAERIKAGVSAIRRIASQNRYPVYIYFTFKDKDRARFKLLPTADQLGGLVKLVAIIDENRRVVACTDSQYIDNPLPVLKKRRALGVKGAVAVIQGRLADSLEVISFSLEISLPETRFDRKGTVCLALQAPPKSHVSRYYQTALILWFGSGLAALVVIWRAWARKNRSSPKGRHQSGVAPALSGCKVNGGELNAAIQPYRIKRLLATGGMANVFLGVNARDGAGVQIEVVIKQILPDHIDDAEDFARLFEREARTCAKLGGHPNIVQIYDYFSHCHVIVMQYVNGLDLQTILKNKKQGIPIELTLYIISEIVNGLDYAHTKTDDQTGHPLNIIHRDIKPGNILISYTGQVKIADFGIAKAVGDRDATMLMASDHDTTLLPLALKGTPGYMAPEQAAQETVDCRSDLFSLGLIFHEMLTGAKVRKSMRGHSSAQIIKTIDQERIRSVSELNPAVSPAINAIVKRCLQTNPERRYPSARDVRHDLKRVRDQIKTSIGSSELADFMRSYR